MSSLIEVVVVEPTNQAFVWYCSTCNKVFGLERVPHSEPSVSELKRVNADFQLHCTRDHAGQPVVEIEIKTPSEDESQAAAMIVREATGRD